MERSHAPGEKAPAPKPLDCAAPSDQHNTPTSNAANSSLSDSTPATSPATSAATPPELGLLTPEQAALCQERIGYTFRDPSYLLIALTHASGADHRLASNERMEFLGDAILGKAVCEQLYRQFPGYLEGELTRIKSIVVSRETCTRVSKRLQLDTFLLLGKGMMTSPTIPNSVLAAVLESIIAAIFLDGGSEAADAFIARNIWPEIDSAVAGEVGGNFKSQLQQYAQREHGVTPTYVVLCEEGPDHSKSFQIAARISQKQYTPAWGRSKKESEQKAANNAICELNNQPAPFQETSAPENP